jgi:hypothetical protein
MLEGQHVVERPEGGSNQIGTDTKRCGVQHARPPTEAWYRTVADKSMRLESIIYIYVCQQKNFAHAIG